MFMLGYFFLDLNEMVGKNIPTKSYVLKLVIGVSSRGVNITTLNDGLLWSILRNSILGFRFYLLG